MTRFSALTLAMTLGAAVPALAQTPAQVPTQSQTPASAAPAVTDPATPTPDTGIKTTPAVTHTHHRVHHAHAKVNPPAK